MPIKLYLLFIFYKKHFTILTFATVLLLLIESKTDLSLIILLKLMYFLGLKVWHKLLTINKIEITYTDSFFFYENLGLHNIYLFLFGFVFDCMVSGFIFYTLQYFMS